MKWQPLFPGRDRKAGSDKHFDTMFERALSVREFARLHGWPLPQPERFKWRRCLLVTLGALLTTLLLGQLLEHLRLASTQPTAPAIENVLKS
jgi:hypothetical protein